MDDETKLPATEDHIPTGVLPEEGYRLRPHFWVAIGMLAIFVVLVALAQAGFLTFFANT